MSIPPDALAFIIGAMIGAAFACAALVPAILKQRRRVLAMTLASDLWERGHVAEEDVFALAKRVEAYLGV